MEKTKTVNTIEIFHPQYKFSAFKKFHEDFEVLHWKHGLSIPKSELDNLSETEEGILNWINVLLMNFWSSFCRDTGGHKVSSAPCCGPQIQAKEHPEDKNVLVLSWSMPVYKEKGINETTVKPGKTS